MIRAFLGLELPPKVTSAVTTLQFLLPLPRRMPPEQFHITLVFLGDTDAPTLEALHDHLAAVRVEPFPLSLQGLGLFGGDQPSTAFAATAPSDPLVRLQARVEHAARAAGATPEHRRFTPHVTVGRFSPLKGPNAAPLERAIAETAFATDPWLVTGMVLWQSHLGPKGSRYEELARYPFAG